MDKVQMQYRVVSAHNPKDGSTILRPVVTNRNTMTMRQLVAYAQTAAYVRGQTKDLEGLLGGFIQAMQDRAQAGYSINVNDWFIISGRLKGKVDETRQLSSDNSYHVTITASKDLKVDIDTFSWSRVDEGLVMRIESITSPNGNKDEITKTKAIVANGKNLDFASAWGDSATVSWIDAESKDPHELSLTINEKSETYLRFDWPEGLAEVPEGTELTFRFRDHGETDGAEQPMTRVAPLGAAA